MNKLQTVYIPTKVEDELPELDKSVFTLNTMIKGRVKFPPEDNGENISINCRKTTIPNGCESWYDENNFGTMYSKVHTWLKPTEAYIFTQEELKQVLSDAFDAGNKRGYGYDSDTREEYIENFLNKK